MGVPVVMNDDLDAMTEEEFQAWWAEQKALAASRPQPTHICLTCHKYVSAQHTEIHGDAVMAMPPQENTQ